MRRSLLFLLSVILAAHAGAAPAILGIEPHEGFNFGPTHVTILGRGFADGAVQVLFGDVQADVLEASDTRLRVLARPTANGTVREPGVVDVTVRVAGHGEVVVPNSFFFDPNAQPGPEDYVSVLLPLATKTSKGAHGSVWETQLRIFNAAHLDVRLPGPEQIFHSPPVDPDIVVSARETIVAAVPGRDTTVDGAFLYVPKPMEHAPRFSLRVRDTSINAANLGTEIPVVREEDAGSDLVLFDVPNDPHYRATLRIYGFTPAPMPVGVSVYPENSDTPIEQYDVTLNGIFTAVYVPFPPHPAYLALDPLTPAVRASTSRVRIEVTNYGSIISPPGPPIWAFVSITNNETQQVTLVTPK
ncbi:MAG TPA: IPT/TIG domain-containing protein [Thermoanaerobaculia bacterium]|jgi:hypothetical protein|nr:IPT/TIG domain-containing protein [Thermoanaerobaculia bacterium]